MCFRLPAYHRLWVRFPANSANSLICNQFSTYVFAQKRKNINRSFPVLLPRLHNKLCDRFGLIPFRSPLLRELHPLFCKPLQIDGICKIKDLIRSIFLRLLRCFTSAGTLSNILCIEVLWVCHSGFPHSEIPGSQVAKHLTEAYRSHATSFIAI